MTIISEPKIKIRMNNRVANTSFCKSVKTGGFGLVILQGVPGLKGGC